LIENSSFFCVSSGPQKNLNTNAIFAFQRFTANWTEVWYVKKYESTHNSLNCVHRLERVNDDQHAWVNLERITPIQM